jgi:hypothetical protein
LRRENRKSRKISQDAEEYCERWKDFQTKKQGGTPGFAVNSGRIAGKNVLKYIGK